MVSRARLGVDVGGTFTDVVLLADGTLTTVKVSTTDDQSEGVIAGIETACDRAGVDPSAISVFRHAMTVTTNAMLEGTGAKTALVTTAGFGDVIEIGRQDRPAVYDQTVQKPTPLVPRARRYEIDERATPDGIETPVDCEEVRTVARQIDDTVESVAVCLLHAYAHPENEKRVAETLREHLDATVIPSHETLPEFREYERTVTTVVDASVTPVLNSYLDRLKQDATERGVGSLQVMQSNGGIADPETLRDHAATTILSGPAAGVVGASLFDSGTHSGIITLDMGGTSTDVGLVVDGEIERTQQVTIGGYPVGLPMVDIETVGAGGGSIAWVDSGGALRVGPDSAGAQPGPVCYGRGGQEPTVTDAALQLGYLGSGTTLADGLSLQADSARRALAEIVTEAGFGGPTEAARGIYRVGTATMARAIREMTVNRGYDPRKFILVAFGGAGPMHAGALAETLGIPAVRVPRANGVLSALGLLAADERHDVSTTCREILSETNRDQIERTFEELTERVRDRVTSPGNTTVTRRAAVRYENQSHELTVPVARRFEPASVRARFQETHERERGYRLTEEPVELVSARVTATVSSETPSITHEGSECSPRGTREVVFGTDPVETPVYRRESIPTGQQIEGPAVFEGDESTVAVPPSWQATVDQRGTIELTTER